jgi:uncharacterized protein involved in exopolysaccharide biosynthesis
LRRYLETLFRLKELFLIPIIAVPVIAVLALASMGRQYEIKASVWVEPSPLLDPVALSRTPPNQLEAQALKERLETESFRKEIMDKVGLTDAILQGQWPVSSKLGNLVEDAGLARVVGLRTILKQLGLVSPSSTNEALRAGLSMIKRSIRVTPEGNNLLRITYNGKEPELGRRLIEETITLYNEKTLQNRVQEGQAGIDFYGRQVLAQEARVREASEAVRQHLEQYPAPPPGQARSAIEQAELDNLQRAYNLELALYESALRKLEQVRVAAEGLVSNRTQFFQVVDPPSTPDPTRFTKRGVAAVLLLGLTLGVGLGLLPIIFFTWIDNTVRSRQDIEKLVNTSVILDVPLIPLYRKQPQGHLRVAFLRRGGDWS